MVANRAVARSGILTRMAKDQFSFDIVSEVDLQEVRNAVDHEELPDVTLREHRASDPIRLGCRHRFAR